MACWGGGGEWEGEVSFQGDGWLIKCCCVLKANVYGFLQHRGAAAGSFSLPPHTLSLSASHVLSCARFFFYHDLVNMNPDAAQTSRE